MSCPPCCLGGEGAGERFGAYEPPVGISWGDARIGNMIVHDDLSVAAVTDWEMASLAPAEVDLAWYDTLALTRYAAAMVRMGDLFARSGQRSDDTFVYVNPIVSMLAARLDLPEPSRPD